MDDYEPTDEPAPLPDWVYYAIVIGFVVLAVIGAAWGIHAFATNQFFTPDNL